MPPTNPFWPGHDVGVTPLAAPYGVVGLRVNARVEASTVSSSVSC